MFGVRDVLVLVGVLALGAAARADMMSVSPMDIECRRSVCVCSETKAPRDDSASLLDYRSVVGLDLGAARSMPEAGEDLKQTSETRHPQILADGQSSLSLCLSALIGLGVCSSAHCFKKLHFGFIPEWYHHGGPIQIGHSIAVDPNSFCPTPVCCFIQPVHTAEDIMTQYRSGTVVSLWRKSQFTPDVIASRGPPVTC